MSAADDTADAGRPPRRIGFLVAVGVAILALDLVTKIAAVAALGDGGRIQLIDGVASFVLVRNPGAAFSMATGMTWVLTVTATLVVVGIVRYAGRLRSVGWSVALGLVLGGALGNLVDRFFRAPGPLEGHVVDFVSIGWWPVFNVADSAICVGGAVLVVLALRGVELDGTRPAPAPPLHDSPQARAERHAERPAAAPRPERAPWPAQRWDRGP